MHKKITLKPFNKTLIKKLIEEFEYYLYRLDGQRLESRKENNPEFKRYCDNPATYKDKLNQMVHLSAQTEIVYTYFSCLH